MTKLTENSKEGYASKKGLFAKDDVDCDYMGFFHRYY
jgi:hypothetical protein